MLNKKNYSMTLALLFGLTISSNANSAFNDPFFQDPFGDDIFKEMRMMQEDMNKMFSKMQQNINRRSSVSFQPIFNQYRQNLKQRSSFEDKKDHYLFVTSIPKSQENKIDINTNNGILTINAKIIKKEEHKTATSFSSSSFIQHYNESATLPKDADVGTLKMEYKNDYLAVVLDKKASLLAKPKKEKVEKKVLDANRTKK